MNRPFGLYSDLRPVEIEAILKVAPIAYVPWGALEWHSQHAPIGLDSVKAEGICKAIAQETGGVVLPAIPMGVNTIKPFKGFPHSIDISADLASRVAEEFCLQLADEGFKVVILFTGHYPPEQIDALQVGADKASSAVDDTHFEVWADLHFLGDDFQADHAGATETSFQMHFVPGSVDVSSLPDRPVTLDDDGITGGDPREASAERGAEQLAVVVKRAKQRLDEILKDINLEL
ncbi:MAG: creatininase family protein [Opitutales bacterium]|jgi:creatinine amidohydrolase|nr:creatininase family protein [Opitutales bacterium]